MTRETREYLEEVFEKDNENNLNMYFEINEVFGDSHICEIKKEFTRYDKSCEEGKCDFCALNVGDGICLRKVFERKWELEEKYLSPKSYLKWDDLEKDRTYNVLLNGSQYELVKRYDDYEYHCDYITLQKNPSVSIFIYEYEKEFFNDLHLERWKNEKEN